MRNSNRDPEGRKEGPEEGTPSPPDPREEGSPGLSEAPAGPEVRQAGMREGLLTWGAVLLLLLVGSQAFQIGGGLTGRLSLLALQLALVLLPTLLAVRLAGGSEGRDLLLRPLRAVVGALAAITALCALPLMGVLVEGLRRILPGAEELEEALTQALRAESGPDLVLVLIVAALAPAVCEEVLFRGWILTTLRRSMTPSRALALQAVLFGLLHLHPLRILPMTALGLLLGWFALRSGSILAPVLGHAIFNGAIVLSVQLGDTVAEEVAVPSQIEAPPVAALAGTLLVFLAIFLVGCALFWWFTRPGTTGRARA